MALGNRYGGTAFIRCYGRYEFHGTRFPVRVHEFIKSLPAGAIGVALPAKIDKGTVLLIVRTKQLQCQLSEAKQLQDGIDLECFSGGVIDDWFKESGNLRQERSGLLLHNSTNVARRVLTNV